jgi:histidine triad (HIT) family protein
MGCVFCKIVKGEIPCHKIYESDNYLCFLDINPITEGHVLLIPKKHIDYVFDMPRNEYSRLFLEAKKISEKLKKATNVKRIGLAIEGFAVPHVHLHLVPLTKGNQLNPENAKPLKHDQLIAIADKIKKQFLEE